MRLYGRVQKVVENEGKRNSTHYRYFIYHATHIAIANTTYNISVSIYLCIYLLQRRYSPSLAFQTAIE